MLQLENAFYDIAIENKMYSNKRNLQFRLQYLFNEVNFSGMKVLDVGGGKGLLSFYAAAMGASKVVCLEPEMDGSSTGMINKFKEIKSALFASSEIEHYPVTLQDFLQQAADDEYDIIVMHNVINHLNEDACITLKKSQESYLIYKEIFARVYNKIKKGGKLIVADCSCDNFFNTIGAKCIFNPTIEWHKHQRPSTWISLLKEIGFKNPKIEWSSPNSLGQTGRVFMGNPLMSYLTQSHFKFTIQK